MLEESTLRRLAEGMTPSHDLALRLKARIQRRIEPAALKASVAAAVPSLSFRQSLRQTILSRLVPDVSVSFVHGSLKWGAAFAVFLLAVRAMPLVFLAPATKADIGVQLLPSGDDVSVLVGGVWRPVSESEVVRGPLMIRTGSSRATVIFNDDGVVRLKPGTTFKIHDVGDRPQFSLSGPTATLVRGQAWVLGLLQPLDDGISIETSQGDIVINSGSASLSEEGDRMTVAVYDRGVTFRSGKQTAFVVSGESGRARNGAAFSITALSPIVFGDPFVSANLEQDAVHRTEIAKLQQDRRERMAGILPTSILYSAKRIAERVDVLFTLTKNGRTEKLVAQADTRLSEALALVKEGQNTEAVAPLTEYRDSLIAMASGTGDNLVKFLIKRQIADATAEITPSTSSGKIQLVRSAVMDITAAIPDTELQAKDIEGYVLVDTLAEINQTLSSTNNLTGALVAYADVSPYLKSLLAAKDGPHPLLRREAVAFLVSTSELIKKAAKGSQNKILVAVQSDIGQYLPAETEKVEESNAVWDAQVELMRHRIIDNLITPGGRYNQLLVEMDLLRNNPDRGHLLRLLKSRLPEGLGEYVNTEIKNFGDELKGR